MPLVIKTMAYKSAFLRQHLGKVADVYDGTKLLVG